MNIQQPIKPTRGNKAWNGKDIAELLEMSSAGFTDNEIGEVLGRTRKAVGQRRNKLVRQVTETAVNKPTRRRGKLANPTREQIQESADRYFADKSEPELTDDWVDTFAVDTSGSITKEEAAAFTSPVQSSIGNDDDSYHIRIPKPVIRIALIALAVAAGVQVGMYL